MEIDSIRIGRTPTEGETWVKLTYRCHWWWESVS